MVQKHRINTRLNTDKRVTLELKQNYDLIEILSLKFTQQDAYTSLCADYGVVCGRISVNNGLGVPNARVSIFVPLTEQDELDPVVSALYPYKLTSDVNADGYKYNLLPSRKQHGGHEPTGTFPDQTDILTREEYLEVFEKYFKYTVKTNSAGDFMIWGVPLGEQLLHVDVDLSDIGCFSLRPYDFLNNGFGVDSFKNTYSFKSSTDHASLPQIVSFDRTIDVAPFWGNVDLCQIGITRTDFDLSDQGVKIEPKAFLIGGTYTDTGKNALNKNCQPRRKMGRKCDLTTKTGTIEAIRFSNRKDASNRPILELLDENQDIPDDGSFVMQLPMNTEFIYTNEFGENEITNDPNKGIPTAACYRLRFSLDDNGNERVRKSASYLVPNIREYSGLEDESYAFSTSWDDYPTSAVSNDSNRGILYNELGLYYPRDYFYRVTYNKVYTISSFQNIHYKGSTFSNDRYVGIKEIVPTEEEDCSSEIVTPPVNFGVKNFTFALLISEILLFLEHLLNLVLLTFLNTIARVFHQLADAVDFWPIGKLSKAIRKFAYRLQDASQRELYLINYPECEECNDSDYGVQGGLGDTTNYCEVGTVTIAGSDDQTNRSLRVIGFTFSNPADPTSNCYTGATVPTSTSNFISNQSNYIITYSSFGAELTGTTVFGLGISPSGYKFQDDSQIFTDNADYIVTIRDKNATENQLSITTLLEDGCELYDVPYDENLVEIYYIGTGRTEQSSYSPGDDVTATKLSDTSDYRLVTSYDGESYTPISQSGYVEFTNGIFKIIPGSLSNGRLFSVLKEYRRRKRVGKLFCGGIVNYSFIDNWLSGSLYFFQFKGKKGKYCEDVIRYVGNQDKFYYRSAIYTSESDWGGVKNGQLGRPTTMVDLGPRDEFIKEICTDPSLDPNCSVSRSIGPTSYQSFGELLGLAINYRMDVSDNSFDINEFFDNGGFTFTNRVLDGDILQLISINNEVGIEEFDLQNPKYLGYSYQWLDPDLIPDPFKNGTSVYGPLPITFYLDEDGQRVRACLNEPTHIANDGSTLVQGRLTESSQKVPFYLWDKKGSGFGAYNSITLDNQSWDYNNSNIQIQPLQGMTYGYNITGATDDSSDKYLLLPMTYTFSGLTLNTGNVTDDLEFDEISTTNNHSLFDSQYPGFTYLYVTGGTITSPTAGRLYTRYGNAGTWHDQNWTYENNFIFDEISTTNNHSLFDSQYPGFTYLYVTGGTITSPTAGTLYTRYGNAGTWHSQNWTYENDFIIRKTQDYYSGNKQILSTPFMFYFGLKVGKTGLDKFVELFGDKGAFTSAE